MIDPLILKWKSFKIIQLEYLSGIKKAPDYICNGLGHCPEVKESDDICPFEIMLVLQITYLCSLLGKWNVGKMKRAQHGLKGKYFLVPADLKKIQRIQRFNCEH